jgi:hypothetical protein
MHAHRVPLQASRQRSTEQVQRTTRCGKWMAVGTVHWLQSRRLLRPWPGQPLPAGAGQPGALPPRPAARLVPLTGVSPSLPCTREAGSATRSRGQSGRVSRRAEPKPEQQPSCRRRARCLRYVPS